MFLNSFPLDMVLFCMLAMPISILAQPIESAVTHCHSDEVIQFSCQVATKTVSLCSSGKFGSITSLAYRYGSIGKVENEFIARANNTHRFYGTASPANPGALVNQVWFERSGIRYLLTECVGGSCPQSGGLAVLRGSHVLMNKPCTPTDTETFDSFSRDFVSFDSNTGGGWSATELLIIGLDDNYLQKLFPLPRGVTW